jgi:DNA-binding MarR family transcriptional regulator
LSVKQIAMALQLDSATLSPMLKRLQALGLITRTRSAADERSTDVELTNDGAALRTRALEIPPAVVARLGVDMAVLEDLRRVLTAVNSAALAAGALPIQDQN